MKLRILYTVTVLIVMTISFPLVSQDNGDSLSEINIDAITFKGMNILEFPSTFKDFDKGEANFKFNIAYSAVLPPGGIYKITDTVTGREAIIQIALYMAKTPPKNIYLPGYVFSFFSERYEKKVDAVNLKVQFLGFANGDKQPEFVDIKSLVIAPGRAKQKITQDGDKYYVQLGSYEYYQNSYPKITEMLPLLELRPNFYMVEYKMKQGDGYKTVYRVLAGPYTKEDAKKIVSVIKKRRDKSVFYRTGKSAVKNE